MNTQKLKLGALVAIVVSSMIGSGVDSLPQNMAATSAVGPVVIAWLICGFGMYFIAQTFVRLSDLKPELETGVYTYPKEGFGQISGFLAGWGYWLMTICSNVAFAIMVMDVLDYFIPGEFTDGNNLPSIIGASILIWGFNYLVLSGTKVAGAINFIGTVAKMIPLAIFVGVVTYFIDMSMLTDDIWGRNLSVSSPEIGSISSQILSPLYVAMWCFIGVEGAVALSGRAQNKRDIGRATMIGFTVSLTICIVISIIPFGVLSQHKLSLLQNPSTADVMNFVVGKWGEVLINVGVLISILSSWLAWTMICAEVPMAASLDGTFPKWFSKCNKNGAAQGSLWASSVLMQIAILLSYFSSDAWLALLAISSLMVLPSYFMSAAYLGKLHVARNKTSSQLSGRMAALVTSLIGMTFCILMLFSSEPMHILFAAVLFIVGLPLYIFRKM